MPRSGKRTIGRSDVIGMGIGSGSPPNPLIPPTPPQRPAPPRPPPAKLFQAFGSRQNESKEKKRGPEEPTRDLTTAEADAVPFNAIHVLPSTLQGCGGT